MKKMSTETKEKALMGGEFLIRDVRAKDVFIPEEWNEEQVMMKQTCLDFVNQEIVPLLERIEKQEEGLGQRRQQ